MKFFISLDNELPQLLTGDWFTLVPELLQGDACQKARFFDKRIYRRLKKLFKHSSYSGLIFFFDFTLLKLNFHEKCYRRHAMAVHDDHP